MDWYTNFLIECEDRKKQVQNRHIVLWWGLDGLDTTTGEWVSRRLKKAMHNYTGYSSPFKAMNEEYKNQILLLLECSKPRTIRDITKHFNLTGQKIAFLCRCLEQEGKIEKIVINSQYYFQKAS